MAAFIILDVEVTNTEAYEHYKQAAGSSLKAYGGEFVVRGGPFEVLEGEWQPNRLVVLRFESVERAKEWYSSEEYRAPKELRWKSSNGNMVLVEGGSTP